MSSARPLIALVVGAAENNVIGNKGDMPWKVSADLRNFKAITSGKPIIMGRKTFDSIGRPLPNRRNIVVTRNAKWHADGAKTAQSLPAAIELAAEASEIMVIGGGELYAQALPLADRIYFTHIHATPDGDTWFPALSDDIWQKTRAEKLPHGPNDTADATFCIYDRINT
ncbi:MAG: dihydrofolate reductase [Hyphomicrobiales bacterium]